MIARSGATFLFGGLLTRSRAQVGVLVAVVAVGVGYYFYSLP